MAITPEVRIYDTSGARQPLPTRFILGWQFELVDRGGCGTFELTLAAELDDATIPALPQGDWRVEFRLDGALLYRGWALQATGGLQDGGGPYKLMGTGRMARCGNLLVDAAYARPGGEDIGEIFAWILTKYLTGAERLGEVADAIQRDTGYEIERAEFFGSNVREAFDRMAESAAGLLIWGWDVTPGGADRLYVKLRPTTTPEAHLFRVGGNVAYYQQPVDLSELVNAIRLVGGSSKAPNLLFNPSWELPAVPGEDASGNLLGNPSFEGDGGWTFTPSAASIRQQSGGEPGEYARTGNWLAELDNGGDSLTQTVTLPTGGEDQPYRLIIHHAREFASTPDPEIKIKVEELNNANGVQAVLVDEDETDATADTYGRIISTSRTYEKWEKELLTSDPDTTKLRITITRVSGATLVDDVYLFADGAVQEGWMARGVGGWKGKVLWACDEVPPFHGAYCLKATVTSGATPATNSRHFQILPNQDRWLQARELTNYVLKIRVRGEAGKKLKLGLHRLKSGGGTSITLSPELTLDGTGEWETFTATLATAAGMTQIRPFVALWTKNAAYYLDAFEVYESGLEDRADADFLDGEALTYYLRSDDTTTLPNLSADAQASIATYGLREAVVEVPEITELAAAKTFATGYLNRYAVPLLRGQLALEPAEQVLRYVEADADATPTGMIGIRGAGVELPDQFPVRIVYSLTKDGVVRCELDLTNRRPDRNLLLKKALGGKTSGGGGGYGGGGTNLRPGPGNSGNGGEDGTAPTWRVEDADIGARSSLNFRAGPGVTLSGTDDETDDEVEIEISAGVGARPVDLVYFAQTTAISVAGPGAGAVEITAASRMQADLTDYTEARIGVYLSTAGATGATVRAQYSTDGGSSWDYLDGASGPSAPIDVGSSYHVGAWVLLDPLAQADVLLRAVVYNGNSIASPQIFKVHLQVR